MNSKRVLLSVGAVIAISVIMGGVAITRKAPVAMKAEQSGPSVEQVLSVADKPKSKPLKQKTSKPSIAKEESSDMSIARTPKLIWQQDFNVADSSALDSRYWNVANSALPIYNEEQQIYSPGSSNVRVAGGRLILEAHNSTSGITSGRVDTKGKVRVEQGTRLEASIKLPKGKGVWPAFWLLSDNQPHTVKLQPTESDWQSPRFYMRDGEIDIMEAYGTFPGVIEATAHTFGRSYEKQHNLPDSSDVFHTYWLEWHADKLVIGVDDTTYSTYEKSGTSETWPFTRDNQFYVILNLAMGGSGGGQITQSTGDNWRMEVDYIRYLQL